MVVGLADGEAPASAKGAGFPSTNWAGNILWSATEVALPESVDELRELVAAAAGRVRCVGRSHSFTPAADTDGLLMSLARMQAILQFDDEKGRITVEGGATYTTINNFLQDTNWAVKNLATLPHFTVAGSISMGTHGSSGVGSDGRVKLGNQASQVSAIEFVLPDGSLKAYSREGDPETFDGVVVGLGCLGPISSITLDLTPSFNVVQAVYIDITVESVIKHFRDMVNNVDSFSWLVDWPKGEENADMSALQGVVRVQNQPWAAGCQQDADGVTRLTHGSGFCLQLGRNRLLVRTFVSPGVSSPPELAPQRWGGSETHPRLFPGLCPLNTC